MPTDINARDDFITFESHTECCDENARHHRIDALEEAAKVVEACVHAVPDEGGDELDRIARYANVTLRNVAAAIRNLKGE